MNKNYSYIHGAEAKKLTYEPTSCTFIQYENLGQFKSNTKTRKINERTHRYSRCEMFIGSDAYDNLQGDASFTLSFKQELIFGIASTLVVFGFLILGLM